MTALILPTLAGIARMVPIRDDDTLSNVGASWTVDAFTVPAGRVLAIDWARLQSFSGTLPTVLRIALAGAGAGGNTELLRETPVAVNLSVSLTNTVWLEEAGILRFAIGGGDDTTGIGWAFAGRLFDWVDVT